MISNYENIINAICDKFHNHIAPLKVVNWLQNFDKPDWKKALIVLNALEYFTTNDIIKEFDTYLSICLKDIDNKNPIYVLPVGIAGKSGLAMIYYMRKTAVFIDNKITIISTNSLLQLNEGDNLILVDDFSGSGETITNFINIIQGELPKSLAISVVTIAYLKKARLHLEKQNIQIYGNERFSAFQKRGSVFGYLPKMKVIREFCFKYGDLLYPEKKYRDNKTKLHPLGYANSQALIAFEHAVPNNSLSIIWADKKRSDSNENWQPIFPRRTQSHIKEANDFKKTSAYWISLLYKLGLESNFNLTPEKYSNYNISVLSVLLLKRKRKNAIYICQYLGLNLIEYEAIVKEGIKSKVLNEDGNLSDSAQTVIEQVRKKIQFEKEKYIKPELVIEEDMLYLPKIFLGNP